MLKQFYHFALLFLLTMPSLWAQQVSTLLHDSSREFAAMHWHEDGRIYAVDYFNGRLYQVYLDGTVETLVDGFVNLAGGGFDQAGNFYFAAINQGIIYRLNTDNSYTEVASGFEMPVGVRASSTDDDTMYVTEFSGNKVTKFSLSTGARTPFVTGNGVNGPDAIIYDWEGQLMVSNWNNHRIHQIDAEGNVSLFASITEAGFMGYVDRIGDYLYVPSFSGRQVYRINREGEVTLLAGTGGSGQQDGSGASATFLRPNGTCHNPSGDTLLVSDDHAIRIITNLEPLVTTTELLDLAELRISPNPTSSQLQIRLRPLFTDSLQWAIRDQQGRTLRQGNITVIGDEAQDLELDISLLPAGSYHFQLSSINGVGKAHPFMKQ